MIGAIVIAAGASYRMGSPKALLKIGERTFLQQIVGELQSAGIAEIIVVLGADAEVIQKSLSWFHGRIVVNEHWKKGQLTSIIAGLCSLRRHVFQAALICPVDHPRITQQLITDLLRAFQRSGKNIIVPSYKGRRGHPVLFASALFDELQGADTAIGARQVVRNHPDDVYEAVTDEKGVVLNIDTPEDYQTNILSNGLH